LAQFDIAEKPGVVQLQYPDAAWHAPRLLHVWYVVPASLGTTIKRKEMERRHERTNVHDAGSLTLPV
jgi:hypothetical protein